MSNLADVNAALMGGGGRSAKFDTIGAKVIGTIIGGRPEQQTDLDGKPKTWDNGDPMMQQVITLQTDLRDDDTDDGKRNLYVKGSLRNPTSLAGAIAAAVRASGVPGMKEGGKLAVEYIGDGTPTRAGFSAPKQYRAQYSPPVVNLPADGGDMFGDD